MYVSVSLYSGTCAQQGSKTALSCFLPCPPSGVSVSHTGFETDVDPQCLQCNAIPNVPNQQHQNDNERLCQVLEADYWRDSIGNVTNPLILSFVLYLLWRNGPLAVGPCDLGIIVTMKNQGTCVEFYKTYKSLLLHGRLEGLQKKVSSSAVRCCYQSLC